MARKLAVVVLLLCLCVVHVRGDEQADDRARLVEERARWTAATKPELVLDARDRFVAALRSELSRLEPLFLPMLAAAVNRTFAGMFHAETGNAQFIEAFAPPPPPPPLPPPAASETTAAVVEFSGSYFLGGLLLEGGWIYVATFVCGFLPQAAVLLSAFDLLVVQGLVVSACARAVGVDLLLDSLTFSLLWRDDSFARLLAAPPSPLQGQLVSFLVGRRAVQLGHNLKIFWHDREHASTLQSLDWWLLIYKLGFPILTVLGIDSYRVHLLLLFATQEVRTAVENCLLWFRFASRFKIPYEVEIRSVVSLHAVAQLLLWSWICVERDAFPTGWLFQLAVYLAANAVELISAAKQLLPKIRK